MRKLIVIGIGAGDPEHITVQAIKALNRVDVFFVLDKGESKQDLMRLRREICERFIEQRTYRVVELQDPVRDASIADYAARVDAWHEQRALLYERVITDELGDDACGGFLVWGDPSLYDSTLRIVLRVVARANVAFEYEVIPGISSVQVLAAKHKLALNRIGGAIEITTGRRLAAARAVTADDVVVMLDGEQAFEQLASNADLDIYWGAYLGTADELLISGKLCEVGAEIVRIRSEARARHGWIMDTYLLRRRRP
jgi:precorrin-6A synthase